MATKLRSTPCVSSRSWLEAVHARVRATPDAPWLDQPLGNGASRRWSWAQAIDESKRIAVAVHGGLGAAGGRGGGR